jgi:endoglucanase
MLDRHRLQGAAVVALLLASPAAAGAGGPSAPAFAVNGRLSRGVNIIGYDPIWQDRAKGRFQERHFARIREAGFTSVRINLHPFRHMDAANGFALKPAWLETLDWAVKGALGARLAVILDMHEFHAMAEDPAGRKEAWLAFWRQVAPRFKDAPDDVVFELLNEPFGKLTPELWNDYLMEGLAVVRATNPTRTVILGGGRWNSIDSLQTLVLPEDDRNLIATVHYYTPMEFTHQGAPWNEETKALSSVPWTGTDEERQRIELDFAKAQQWAVAHDRPVFLGEFGAYDKAPMDSRARYTAAVARTAERLGWSWAYWQFDSDFILYDVDKDAWVEPLEKALVPSAVALAREASFIPPGYKGSPFGDSRHPRAPQKIPGRLQCELYDVGGPGVAYSDSDGKNSGSGALNPLDGTYLNGFRADEAVDISYTKDRGTPTQDFSEFNLVTPERDSLYLGWTEPGEWVHYTVLVEEAGRYAVDVTYTSNGDGRFELSVDGVPVGTVVLPSTHRAEDPVDWRQWHHWNRLNDALAVELAAGLHLVRIRFLAGNTNLDYLEIRRR